MFVSRIFAEVEEGSSPSGGHELAEFRAIDAYVLLGDPGAGKSTSFEHESQEVGGRFITARDFLTFSPREEWRNTILFIDALDETRASGEDGCKVLDGIRAKLDQLGRPRFRLSCREADWLGASDREALQRIAPGGRIATLRLEPLNEAQILTILRSRPDISDAEDFLAAAKERGLVDLLDNPQTLLLLVDAFRGHHWPDSKAETYRLACNQLAIEQNQEHEAASRGKRPPLGQVLDAAGYLCALALIADISGISLNGADPDYPSPEHLTPPYPLPFAKALSTRLFRGEGGRERFVPVHRSVAEYLAAGYIARRIDAGLPVSRVLALVTGSDGGVVSGLRGLNAWLAVHYLPSRGVLIDADPLGVVLYGDVKGFSSTNKRQLLDRLHGLAKHYPGFRGQDWGARPFGALSTPDMEPAFREILTSPSRDDAQQALVDCVLDALEYGHPQPALADALLTAARQNDRWLGVRRWALRAYIRLSLPDFAPLIQLLEDIRDAQVEDRDDELLGHLLETLYPAHLPTTQLVGFLHAPKAPNLVGSYHFFLRRKLSKLVPADDLPILLDFLVERRVPYDLRHDSVFRTMTGELLCRAVEEQSDRTDSGRLYAWLGLGLDEHSSPWLDTEHRRRIAAWLSLHPQCYKAILVHAIQLSKGDTDFKIRFYRREQRLYDASPPNDLGLWLLSIIENEVDSAWAREIFERAVVCLYRDRGHHGLSLDLLESWVAQRPAYREQFQSLLYYEIPDWRNEDARRREQRESDRKAHRSAMRHAYRERLEDLRAGTGDPCQLHNVAAAYCDRYGDVQGETPWERLLDLLDGDSELADAALTGLRLSLFRSDLPSVEEIVKLAAKGQVAYIGLPCLVAAEERYREAPETVLTLPVDLLKRLLAFRYADGIGEKAAWEKVLLEARPSLAAEVLVAYATRLFKAAGRHVSGIFPLQHDEAYAAVARYAVPALLKVFPTRARQHQQFDLETLLKAGLMHTDRAELSRLVGEKLVVKRMDVVQRIYWLAVGLILEPARHEAAQVAIVGRSRTRASRLAGFFQKHVGRKSIDGELPATSVGVLIRLLGPDSSPRTRLGGVTRVTRAMEESRLVEELIDRLGSDPTDAAASQIQSFLMDARLQQWHPTLRRVSQSQQVSRREALYRHPSLKEVEQTLANLRPSNAADLAALAGETLRELAREIRDGNTDGYKQFWNLDKYADATEPRVEDACRDTLLDRLRERLGRLGIDAQPEGHTADDKRADIRVSFGGQGCNVPIEIKRNLHHDVWYAIREQLIVRYTRDPGTMGRGSYVVLWFGIDGMPAPPGGGTRSRSAADMEARLINTLTVEEQRLIKVCVINVAKPQ